MIQKIRNVPHDIKERLARKFEGQPMKTKHRDDFCRPCESCTKRLEAFKEMLEALERAAPWLGKLIANDGHLEAVMPNDAIRTLQMVEAALARAAR